MNMDLPYIFGCCLLAIVVCTAHLSVGFWCGLRFRGETAAHHAAVSAVWPPGYLNQVFELVEGSQQLHSQIAEHVRDLPERVIIAAEKLLAVANGLRHDIEAQQETASCGKAKRSRIIEPAHYRASGQVSPESDLDRPLHSMNPHISRGIPDENPNANARLSQGDFARIAGPATYATPEQATYERRPYPVRQFVAFCDGENPPAKSFEQVLCKDISMTGVAFYLNRQPDSDQLIISLGSGSSMSFMLMNVANYVPAVVHGQECYRIGCQFVRRLPNNVYTWNTELQRIEMDAEFLATAR